MNEILAKLILELRPEILLRVLLALLTGLALGLNHSRKIGIIRLRDTMLVTLASCLVMIISDSLYMRSLAESGNSHSWHVSPSLLAAGAVMSMGFIGAGAIIYKSKHLIHDATAAATLWFAALIGMSFGAGVFGAGILATGVIYLILRLVPRVEISNRRDQTEETASSLETEPVASEAVESEVPVPVATMTDGDTEERLYRNGRQQALEQLTQHLSLNQIFPSDLKQRRSTIKLRRIKSRRFIAYMF